MLRKWIDPWMSLNWQRSMKIQSSWSLGDAMKRLNDRKEFAEALHLFDQYKEKKNLKLSNYLISQALKSAAGLGDLKRGLAIDQLIPMKLKNDVYILSSLINMSMKCGDINLAQTFFDRTKEKDQVIYGSMMKGYITNGLFDKAIDLFNTIVNPNEVLFILFFNACAQMRTDSALNLVKKLSLQIPPLFYSNENLVNSLIDALIKCGDCSHAEMTFSRSQKNVITYGNLMNGFNKEKNPQKTLQLFSQMINNDHLQPTHITYLCLINALSQLRLSSLARSLIEKMPQEFHSNLRIQTALIDMWGKCASINKAESIFEKLPEPNHVAYTAMIKAFASNGMGMEAVELFNRMPVDLVNEATYVSVLNACSHAGLVDQAENIFQNIPMKTAKIYAAMTDCLSRAKFFDRALTLIDHYEEKNPPHVSMHMSLLSGARNAQNNSLSEKIVDRMKTSFPHIIDSLMSASVLLANVYASTGEMDKALTVRNQINQSGYKKKVGLVWTEFNGEVFQFRAHDRSHPQSSEIYAELSRISKELLEHGHQFDHSWITRVMKTNETVESILCGHSEKLAIAFHFIQNRKPTRIQITKNLRICGDCHQSTKLIARIRQCLIIIHDANRIHHFYPNGQCSCQDYF